MKKNLKKLLTGVTSIAMLCSTVLPVSANAHRVNHHINNIRTHRVTKRSHDIAKVAKRYLYVPYSLEHQNRNANLIAKNAPKSHVKSANCVSFIWGVYKNAGYRTTKKPSNIIAMEHSKALKHISAKHTKKGDIIYENAMPSCAILLQKWHGKNTKVIAESSYKHSSRITTVKNAFGAVQNKRFHFLAPEK